VWALIDLAVTNTAAWDDMLKHSESLTHKRRATWIKKVTQYLPFRELPDALDPEF